MSRMGDEDFLQGGELHEIYAKPRSSQNTRKYPVFSCHKCGNEFSTKRQLRDHIWTSHPETRPRLIINRTVSNENSIRITQSIDVADVFTDCDQASLNGRSVKVTSLPSSLAEIKNGVHTLELYKGSISESYILEYQIPSEQDLKDIDDQFRRIVIDHGIDNRTIQEFISCTSQCQSARAYREGICSYLYGVLIRNDESSLPYSAYIGKFRRAVTALTETERPLSQLVRALIEFHFNQFDQAIRLSQSERVRKAAQVFSTLVRGERLDLNENQYFQSANTELETRITDNQLERILRWTVLSPKDLRPHISEMESVLHYTKDAHDKIKLRILTGEASFAAGDSEKVLEHVRALRYESIVGKWTELMIHAQKGISDGFS